MPEMDDICPECGYKPPATFTSEESRLRVLASHIASEHGQDSSSGPEVSRSAPRSGAPTATSHSVNTRQTTPAKSKEASKVVSLDPDLDPKKARIAQRTEEWGGFLYRDFNPLLVRYTKTFAQIPDEWAKFGPGRDDTGHPAPLRFIGPDGKPIVFWEPSLDEQLALSEGDCKKMAKAGALFAESPMGMALYYWLEHNAQFLTIGAALVAAGTYGWRLMRIKTEVAQLKEALAQQQAAVMPDAENLQQEPSAA